MKTLAWLSLVAVISSGCAVVHTDHSPGYYHYRPYVAAAPVYRHRAPVYYVPRHYRGY